MENQGNIENQKAASAVAIGSIITIVGSIIAFVVLCVSMCSIFEDDTFSDSEDSNAQFYGTYTFYDALNHKTIINVYEGGDAFYQMDKSSIGDSEIAQLAWGSATNGVNCIWDTRYRDKGGNYHKGIEVSGSGVEVYLADGYAYFSYSDFCDYRDGVRYTFNKR